MARMRPSSSSSVSRAMAGCFFEVSVYLNMEAPFVLVMGEGFTATRLARFAPARAAAVLWRPIAQRRALGEPLVNLGFWKPSCIQARLDRARETVSLLLVVKVAAR